MSNIIRQAFGTTRPKDIFSTMLTFDRMTTRPIIHIVYWVGLGLLFIAAMGVAGVSVGSIIKDHSVMGILLSFPVLIVGLLMVLIGVLLWRAFCEFYMAVLSIADDLRILRQYKERLEPAVPPAQPQPMAQPAATVTRNDPLRFEVPASETPTVEPETGNILEDPFFRPRFGKQE